LVYFSRLIVKGGFFCNIFPFCTCILSTCWWSNEWPKHIRSNNLNVQKSWDVVIVWTGLGVVNRIYTVMSEIIKTTYHQSNRTLYAQKTLTCFGLNNPSSGYIQTWPAGKIQLILLPFDLCFCFRFFFDLTKHKKTACFYFSLLSARKCNKYKSVKISNYINLKKNLFILWTQIHFSQRYCRLS